MAAKALTNEAIALTEKKMDMALDDIIKMSKSNNSKAKRTRIPNKSRKHFNSAANDKSSMLRRFMDSRSSVRQGVLARRRSNFQRNQFPFATEVARKAAIIPIQNRAFNNQSRDFNRNQSRVARKPVNGGFGVKLLPTLQQPRHPLKQKQQGGKVAPTQRPQTLDSLFANMKEQRTRVTFNQKNNNNGRRGGGGQQRPPWARFGN